MAIIYVRNNNGDLGPASSGGNADLAITGAAVGQTVKISEVDENGVPTAWESTDIPTNCEYIKFQELERGKTVYHATMSVEAQGSGTFKVVVLSEDISEQLVAEGISNYEVTHVHTDKDGVVRTYTCRGGEYINDIVVEVSSQRKPLLKHSTNGRSGYYNNGTVEVTVKTPIDSDLSVNPDVYFLSANRTIKIVASEEWETNFSMSEGTTMVPSLSSVRGGLLRFGQTYTSYVEQVSTEPITVSLQPRKFYYFGNTPKITFNRAAVSGADKFCCFMFTCGDTPTELRDDVDTSKGYDRSYGWTPWNMSDTIKPNRTYLGVIRHGIPYVEEYTPSDSSAITDLLGRFSRVHDPVSDLLWVPNEALTEARELYDKYSYMSGLIGVDGDTSRMVADELATAESKLVERVEPVVPEIVCTAYTAVGGESYYLMTGTDKKTATAGMHLIKVTVPASPEGYGDTVYPLTKLYLSVKAGNYPFMTTSNDKYAVTYSSFSSNNRSTLFKPSSDTALNSFRMSLEGTRCYLENGALKSSKFTKYADGRVVTYNELLETSV